MNTQLNKELRRRRQWCGSYGRSSDDPVLLAPHIAIELRLAGRIGNLIEGGVRGN